MNEYEKSTPPARPLPKALAPLVAAWEFDPPDGLVTNRQIAELAGVTAEHARVVAGRLVRAGWLDRVGRGSYRFVPAAMAYPRRAPWPLLAASHTPHLVSGLTAARHHRLTPQIPTRHLVIFSRDKTPPKQVSASPAFRVVRFRPDRIFGGAPQEMDGTTVTVARPERVMIDAAMNPEWVDGAEEATRILRRGFRKSDIAVLIDFITRYGSERLTRRMGWWGDRLLPEGWSDTDRRLLTAMLGSSRGGTLVPNSNRSGPFDARWGVYENVPTAVFENSERVR